MKSAQKKVGKKDFPAPLRLIKKAYMNLWKLFDFLDLSSRNFELFSLTCGNLFIVFIQIFAELFFSEMLLECVFWWVKKWDKTLLKAWEFSKK